MAARAGHCEVAQFLLQNNAQVDAKAKVGRTYKLFCLHLSAFVIKSHAFLSFYRMIKPPCIARLEWDIRNW